jgi:alkylhydroperoxidase family enzyme
MQEVNRIDVPGGPEVFVNFGATVDAAKGNKLPPLVIMHRDSDATKDPIAHVIFNVTDMTATVAAIKAAGGTMDGEPRPFRNTGIVIGIAVDPAGNRIELIQRAAAKWKRPAEAGHYVQTLIIKTPRTDTPRHRGTEAWKGCPRCLCALCIVIICSAIAVGQAQRPPRIAPVAKDQQTDEQRTIAAKYVSSEMPNAVATYLNHPALADHILPYEHYASADSTLPPRHRALVVLRTAWLTRSNYLWAHKAPVARRAGLTADELTRVAQGPDAKGWDAFEATVLRAADELHVDSFISDATWKALSARYDTNQLVDLVDAVGVMTLPRRRDQFARRRRRAERDRPSSFHHSCHGSGQANEPAARSTRRRAFPRSSRGTGRRNSASVSIRTAPVSVPRIVFVTFVRNPPADRLRGPNQSAHPQRHDAFRCGSARRC